MRDSESAEREDDHRKAEAEIHHSAVKQAGDGRRDGNDKQIEQGKAGAVDHARDGAGGVGKQNADDQHVNGGVLQHDADGHCLGDEDLVYRGEDDATHRRCGRGCGRHSFSVRQADLSSGSNPAGG